MDLNDLRYFALIVEHGGFSAAERITHLHRSKLSRRISNLEERLGLRLLQRTTRSLVLTDAGEAYYAHCRAMLAEVEAAEEAVAQLQGDPVGTVRLTCPTVMAQQYVASLIAVFMLRYPKVRVELDTTDRALNIIEERIDIAVRARELALQDPGLVARKIGSGRFIFVASPTYLAARAMPERPEQLVDHDTIGSRQEGGEQSWSVQNSSGDKLRVMHRPRLLCSDLSVQYEATISGVGIAMLPERIAMRGIKFGALKQVLPEWATAEEAIHLVIATRRGLLPAVRLMLDYLAEELPRAMGV